MSGADQENYMEGLDVLSVNDAVFTGKTTKQILLKNSIVQSLRKVIMKDTNIKNIVSSIKQIEDIISETDTFKNLCQPARNHLRDKMVIKQIDEGDHLQVMDPIHLDFIFVNYGVIKVTLEMKKHNN